MWMWMWMRTWMWPYLRGGGLLVGFGEGSSEDARAGDEDLGYDAVRLGDRMMFD